MLWLRRVILESLIIKHLIIMYTQNIPDMMTQSANFVWGSLVVFMPKLFLAVIVFIVFWIIGAALYTFFARLVGALKIDALLSQFGADAALQRGGLTLNSGKFIGGLAKWFFIITGLLFSSSFLGLTQVSGFLEQVLYYIPNIAVAVIILVAGVLLADFVGKVTISSVASAGLKSGHFVSKIVRWAVMIFALIAALDQLGVAQTFINTLYIGIVAMIAIAGGLAFGLGGKEHASELIAKIKNEMRIDR